MSAAFLGSYTMDYTVKSVDKKAGTATIEFHVKNGSDINSGTHIAPELGGYSPWWDENIAVPLNDNYTTGRFGAKEQELTWTETIDLGDPAAPSESSPGLFDGLTDWVSGLPERTEADNVRFCASRSGAGLAAAALTVLTSTACGILQPARAPVETPESVVHSELVGRWDGSPECRSPLPVIRLRDDYTYTVKDFPTEWDGPVPDSQVTRRSTDGKWHAVNKDPGLSPYLVLRFEKGKGEWEIETLFFTLEKGTLWMGTSVEVEGEPGHSFSCDFKRTSADPESAG